VTKTSTSNLKHALNHVTFSTSDRLKSLKLVRNCPKTNNKWWVGDWFCWEMSSAYMLWTVESKLSGMQLTCGPWHLHSTCCLELIQQLQVDFDKLLARNTLLQWVPSLCGIPSNWYLKLAAFSFSTSCIEDCSERQVSSCSNSTSPHFITPLLLIPRCSRRTPNFIYEWLRENSICSPVRDVDVTLTWSTVSNRFKKCTRKTPEGKSALWVRQDNLD